MSVRVYIIFQIVSIIILIVGAILTALIPLFKGTDRTEEGRVPSYINVGLVLIILGIIGSVICAVIRLNAHAALGG